MTRSPDSTESVDTLADLDGEDLACLGLRRVPPDWWAEIHAKLRADQPTTAAPEPPKPARVTQAARQERPPDGLRTPTEAARKLGCSIKTLNGHIESGALSYVIIGHGKKRPRRMFTDADLDNFVATKTRKDAPCPSIVSRARRTSTSTSGSEVIAFTAAPRPRPGAKPKR
jgi:hypothetical protein